MARTSNFANVATVTRASTKTDAGGWDFTSGGTVDTLTEYASGVASIHPTAGLLVEESTTNEIRNPRCEGASAPSTYPANWSIAVAGNSHEVVGSGTENGTPYLDFRLYGTPTTDPQLRFEGTGNISALDGETWTLSTGVKVVGGDQTNINGIKLIGIERASGSFVTQSVGSLETIDSTHKRFFHTFTLSGGGTVDALQPGIVIDWDGSGAIDITLRIYAPQCEEKAYPTSLVFPVAASPAASTRAADDISIPVGAWLGTSAISVHVEFRVHYPDLAASRSSVFSLDDGSFDNILNLWVDNSGGNLRFRLQNDAGSDELALSSTFSAEIGETISVAMSLVVNDFHAAATDGTSNETYDDTSCNVSVLSSATRMVLGADPSGRFLNGYITDFRVWPKQLADAETNALGNT